MLPAQTPTPSPSATPSKPAPRPSFARLPREEQVLSLFLTDQSTTVCEIAEHLNLSIEEVAEILESPKSQALIATIRRLAQARAELIAAEVRTEAIYITRRIANSSTNQETARRAAAALLRFATVRPTPERSEKPSEASAASKAPSTATRGGTGEGQAGAQRKQDGDGPSQPPIPRPTPNPIPALTPETKREALLALAAIADRFTPNTPLPPAPSPTRARDSPDPHRQAA